MIATTFVSCEKKVIQFGSQFVDNDYTQITETDTITPVVSTVYIDSFVTSNSGVGLIGNTTDPEFGTLRSSAYFQLGVPTYSATSTQYNDAVYDSVALYAKLSKGLWYGDTTKPVKINIYQLNEEINFPKNESALYNTNSFSANPTPLASYSFTLRPNALDSSNDTLMIRLPDALGKDLLSKLQNSDVNIQSNDQFVNYFKGLKISADAGPNSNLSFAISDSIQMKVFYRIPDVPVYRDTFATFPLYNSQYQFNNITINRTGALQQANFGSVHYNIGTGQTGNMAFLNPLAGAMIRMTFPTISSVLQQNFIKIISAKLQIYPTPGTYETTYDLPPNLYLVPTDKNNSLGGSPLSDGTSAQTGSLANSYNNTANNPFPNYIYDVTAYLQSYAASPTSALGDNGLLLIPATSSMFSSYNRMIMNDGSTEKASMKLIIDYISIK